MRYNTIVFRRTSSNIQIKDGSTIAAYVAFTKKPFRTNEVLGVSAVLLALEALQSIFEVSSLS